MDPCVPRPSPCCVHDCILRAIGRDDLQRSRLAIADTAGADRVWGHTVHRCPRNRGDQSGGAPGAGRQDRAGEAGRPIHQRGFALARDGGGLRCVSHGNAPMARAAPADLPGARQPRIRGLLGARMPQTLVERISAAERPALVFGGTGEQGLGLGARQRCLAVGRQRAACLAGRGTRSTESDDSSGADRHASSARGRCANGQDDRPQPAAE